MNLKFYLGGRWSSREKKLKYRQILLQFHSDYFDDLIWWLQSPGWCCSGLLLQGNAQWWVSSRLQKHSCTVWLSGLFHVTFLSVNRASWTERLCSGLWIQPVLSHDTALLRWESWSHQQHECECVNWGWLVCTAYQRLIFCTLVLFNVSIVLLFISFYSVLCNVCAAISLDPSHISPRGHK